MHSRIRLCDPPDGGAHADTAQATALYIFPTKALAQDQLRALKEMTAPPYPVRARGEPGGPKQQKSVNCERGSDET